MPMPKGVEKRHGERTESTPLGALGLSLIRGPGECEPGRPRVYGHTTSRIPFGRSSGIACSCLCRTDRAWFPYGNNDFIRAGWIEKKKIVKNVGKVTFFEKKIV